MNNILDRLYHSTETQMGTTATVGGGAYAFTLNTAVAVITIIVLLAQFGLMVPKYWKLYQEWKDKRGHKE